MVVQLLQLCTTESIYQKGAVMSQRTYEQLEQDEHRARRLLNRFLRQQQEVGLHLVAAYPSSTLQTILGREVWIPEQPHPPLVASGDGNVRSVFDEPLLSIIAFILAYPQNAATMLSTLTHKIAVKGLASDDSILALWLAQTLQGLMLGAQNTIENVVLTYESAKQVQSPELRQAWLERMRELGADLSQEGDDE